MRSILIYIKSKKTKRLKSSFWEGVLMKNYWYVSLSNKYPHPTKDNSVRAVQSVQIKKKYSIIEMPREATPFEIDSCRLIYCGVGHFDEQHIQENVGRYIR